MMETLKQKCCKDCFYLNELPDCPNLCPLTFDKIKEWLQQHKKELLERYKTNTSTNISYRINHCNELLEEVE